MSKEQQTTDAEEVIANASRVLVKEIRELSDDPYIQMAALRSAASVIEHKLASCAMKAGVAAALANAINPSR